MVARPDARAPIPAPARRRRSLRRAAAWGLLGLTLSAAAFVVAVVIHGRGTEEWEPWLLVGEMTAAAFAAALCAWRWTERRQWPWAAFTVANVCLVVGHAWHLIVHDLLDTSTDPRPSQGWSVAWSILTMVGFVGIVVMRGRFIHGLVVAMTALQVAVALTLTVWVGALVPIADRHDLPVLDRVWTVYGFVVAFAFAFLGITFWRSARVGLRSLCLFLLAAAAAEAVTASTFVTQPAWALVVAAALMCVGFAFQAAAARLTVGGDTRADWEMSTWRLIITYVPVVLAMAVVVIRFSIRGEQVAAVSMVLTAIVVLLVVVNQIFYWYESQRLSQAVDAKRAHDRRSRAAPALAARQPGRGGGARRPGGRDP